MARGEPPVTPLDIAAVAMHELYESFRRAGFTRSEAVTIIAKTAAEIITQQVSERQEDGDGDAQ